MTPTPPPDRRAMPPDVLALILAVCLLTAGYGAAWRRLGPAAVLLLTLAGFGVPYALRGLASFGTTPSERRPTRLGWLGLTAAGAAVAVSMTVAFTAVAVPLGWSAYAAGDWLVTAVAPEAAAWPAVRTGLAVVLGGTAPAAAVAALAAAARLLRRLRPPSRGPGVLLG